MKTKVEILEELIEDQIKASISTEVGQRFYESKFLKYPERSDFKGEIERLTQQREDIQENIIIASRLLKEFKK